MEQIKDKQIAAKWAYDLLKGNFCILDTETTGLDSRAQVCQISVINSLGEPLLDSLVQPTHLIPESATAIHGITNAMVEDAPSFDEVLVPLLRATGNRDVVIYNAEFDLKLIRQSLYPHKIWLAFPTSDRRQCRVFPNGGSIHCAMKRYSQWVGEWSEYHADYQFQKLPGGDHTALGDCRAVLAILQLMAASYEPSDPVPVDDLIGY